MRWHPLAPDKTYLSYKNEPLTPSSFVRISIEVVNMVMDVHVHHVQNHGNCSNIWKKHLNDPAPLLINIKHP